MLAQARASKHTCQFQHSVPISQLAMVVAARGGRPAEARAELLAVIDDRVPAGNEAALYPLLTLGAGIEADHRGLPGAEVGRAEALAKIAATAAGLTPKAPVHHGWARLLEAELARARGRTPRRTGRPPSTCCGRPGCRTRWRSRCCGPPRRRWWPGAARRGRSGCARRASSPGPGVTPGCWPRSPRWPSGPAWR